MKNRANQCVAICVLILTAAVVQGQGPQKRGDRPASNTGAAAPAPPAAGLPSSSVAMMNTPQHSPDQLDFGSVADGSSVTRTFTLLTNSAGNITLTIPAGPFRVAEFREMGALSGGSKNLSAQPQPAAVSGVRSRIHYQEGQNGPYQWSMAPNVQMQVDIIFASKSQGMKIGGLKSAIMNVSGPGPQGNWVITVPLQGTIKTSSPESPQSPAINHGIVQLQSQRGGNSSAANAASLAGASSPAMRRPSMGQPVLFATKHRADLSPKGVDLKVLSQLQQQKQSAEAARTRITTASPRPAGGQTSKSMGSPTGTNAGIASPSVTSKPGGNDISQASLVVGNTFICEKAAPGALLFSINGQKKGTGVVFTTDPDSNLFTFEGCNFGDTQGSIHLYGGFAHGNIPFEISYWSDKSIVARVQPDLAGELDRDNVNLVLISGNGHQTQFTGYKFYAARQIYPLASIPNAKSKIIFGTPDPDHCEAAKGYTFMNCAVESPDTHYGLTVLIDRWGVQGDKGTDQFNISGLKAGFEVSDISLFISPTIKDKQGWSMNSFAENISVNYVFDWKNPEATYGLQISVTGPRGLDSVWK